MPTPKHTAEEPQPSGPLDEGIDLERLPDAPIEAGDAAPKGPISDVFNLLKRESGPSLTIEEIGERTADGWAGVR
jgi:hypothetical protein